MSTNLHEVARSLDRLRQFRGMEHDPEIRSAYNAACDRLDVLHSKLDERVKRETAKPEIDRHCPHKDTVSVNEENGAVLFRCTLCGAGLGRRSDSALPLIWSETSPFQTRPIES